VRAQAVLRSAGVLKLAPPLAAKIDAGETLRAGGEEEVALRAATVVGACLSLAATAAVLMLSSSCMLELWRRRCGRVWQGGAGGLSS